MAAYVTSQQVYGKPMVEEAPLAETLAYKGTLSSDVVVARKLTLFANYFTTTHSDDHSGHDSKRSFYLDAKCELSPRNAEDIVKASIKHVRPRSTLTLIAAVSSKNKQVQLYPFTLSWPTTWAAKGYTSFMVGFESQDQAQKWHGYLHERILLLKEREVQRRGRHTPSVSLVQNSFNFGVVDTSVLKPGDVPATTGSGHRPSSSAGSGQESGVPPSPPRPSPLASNGTLGLPPTAAKAGTAPPTPRTSGLVAPVQQPATTALATSALAAGALAATPAGTPLTTQQRGDAQQRLLRSAVAQMSAPAMSHLRGAPVAAVDYMNRPTVAAFQASWDSDDEEGPPHAPGGVNRVASRADVNHFSKRWVPWKQTNGVAVYHHRQEDEETGVGGEYMVSAVVRGAPNKVLKVLMSNEANTTILGPARTLEVLSPPAKDQQDKEVLRIVLAAPGMAGMCMAPREMIVERILKVDEAGLYVVMFISCEPPVAIDASTNHSVGPSSNSNTVLKFNAMPHGSTTSNPATAAAAADNAAAGATAAPVAAVRGRRWQQPISGVRKWLQGPVRGWVRGGYTIAPLEGYGLDNSPESLITCIIKVNLGGCMTEGRWFQGMCASVGWGDAFLERILMSVILIRDEVEHQRFTVQPFTLVASAVKRDRLPLDSNSQVPEEDLLTQSHTIAKMSTRLNNQTSMSQHLITVAAAAEETPVPSVPQQSIPENGPMSPDAVSSAPVPPAPEDILPEKLLDIDAIRSLCTLDKRFWEETHTPGKDAPFKVRGPTYLKDRKKIPAGAPQFILGSMDMIEIPGTTPIEHVARFLPAVRQSAAPFSIIVHLIIPGTPLLGIVATFVNEQHPDILGAPPKHPMEEDHDWQPFDFVLHKYMTGSNATRNMMLKLIPHIADGSWMIKQSVGTTPVILGKALKTTYHATKQYLEIDIDISANNVAAYVTGLVRGATKSLVIDMGFVLEGTAPWELPEALLGTLRLNNLDLKCAHKIDITQEIPLRVAPSPTTTAPQTAMGRRHSRGRSLSQDNFSDLSGGGAPLGSNPGGSGSYGGAPTTTAAAPVPGELQGQQGSLGAVSARTRAASAAGSTLATAGGSLGQDGVGGMPLRTAAARRAGQSLAGTGMTEPGL